MTVQSNDDKTLILLALYEKTLLCWMTAACSGTRGQQSGRSGAGLRVKPYLATVGGC